MKKWRAFLKENKVGKRLMSFCLAAAMAVGMVPAVRLPEAQAVQSDTYYGDTPYSSGYYAVGGLSACVALPRNLWDRTDLYSRYRLTNIILPQGNENCSRSYVGGYGYGNLVYTGKVEMAEKWNISNYKVEMRFPDCSNYYTYFKDRIYRMYLTWTLTKNDGTVKRYRYSRNGCVVDGSMENRVSDITDIPTVRSIARNNKWTTFTTFTAPLGSSVSNVGAVFFEDDYPVISSWSLQNREDDTPLLWARFNEPIRPTSDNLLNRELLSEVINLKLELTPANDPNGERMTVDATCVEFDSDGRLGFEILSEDWSALMATGKEWVIRNAYDNCTYGEYKIKFPYPINDFLQVKNGTSYYTAPLPLVDNAGNTFKLYEWNFKDINLRLDTMPPSVGNVLLSGDSLPAASTSGLDLSSWADTPELNWEDLFVGNEDAINATVELTEQIQSLTDQEKSQVYLEWSINDTNGNPLRTYLSEMKDAPYVNGNSTISQLVFQPLSLTNAAADESGKMVRPIRLRGANYLQDKVNNPVSESGDFDISLNPDKQVYLDVQGPAVELGQVVKGGSTDDYTTYSVELTFTDRTSEEADRFFAGMVGGESTEKGSFTIYTTDSIPAMGYSYTLLPAEDTFDGNYLYSGTLGAEAARTPIPLELPEEGSYILYLKLDSKEGQELSDDTGAILDFTLWDILGNTSNKTQAITNLALDRKTPDASGQHSTAVFVGDTNYAEFTATVTASDLNGIKHIDYIWSDGIVNQQPYDDQKEVTFQVPTKTVDGTGTVTESLTVKVYDKYDNETVLDTMYFSADLSKFVPQAAYSGDPNQPSNTNDIVISAPISTENGGKADGYLRLVWEKSAEEVVIGTGSIAADGTVSVFGENSLKWVSATVSNGTYTNVTELADSGLTAHYGYMKFTLWAASEDLAVADGSSADLSSIVSAQSMTLSIARTSTRDDAHDATFGDVTYASGARPTVATYNELEYYSFYPDTFIGVRYPFSIANTIQPGWTTVDVDWDNSYAVLLKANPDGTLPDTEEAVSTRISLAAGIDQVLAVPGLDKDGKAFTTGVYVWKVVLAQKAGGSQSFVAPCRLLLDAVEVNAEFGVYSYTNTPILGVGPYSCYDADAEEDLDHTDDYLELVQQNADGSPLTSIDVAYADAYESESDLQIVQDANGLDAYALVPINGGGELDMDIYLDTTQLGGDTYMGQELGLLEGFRFWNANAPVDLDALPFEKDYESTDGGYAYLSIYEHLEDIVVEDLSTLTPAASRDDFRLSAGKNRIAYQMKLTNGLVSNVMYFDLVLRSVTPTISVEFTPGEGKQHTTTLDDGTVLNKTHTGYVTASVTGYTSGSGSLEFYQLTSEEMYSGGYEFARRKITDPTNIVLTQGGHGYEGLPTGNNYLQPENRDYFLAVDEYGNGVIVLPILGMETDTSNARFDEAVIPNMGKILSLDWENAIKYDVSEKGRYRITINHAYTGADDDSIYQVMDGYSVQVDDREPVYINALGYEYTYDADGYPVDYINHNEDVEEGVNDAGIDNVYLSGMVDLCFPYDPDVELGAGVDHTVTVRAYLGGEITDEKQITVNHYNCYNLKPTLLPGYTELGESELYSKYTNLTDADLAAGITYSSEIRFGYSYTKLIDGEAFDIDHTITTSESGNYTVEFMDKYGDWYTQQVYLNLPDDPKITFSTTEPTVGPVVVTVTSEQYDLTLNVIENYENPDASVTAVPSGTVIEGNGTKELKLTLYTNSDRFEVEDPNDSTVTRLCEGIGVSYVDAEGSEKSLRIYVDNIYNEPVAPLIRWTYLDSEVVETYERDGVTYSNVVFGTVDAVLVDENDIPLIDPLTGETPKFTFEPGGVTSYTFSGYTNIAGVAGADITASLPVTLLWYEEPVLPDTSEEPADTWAPNVAINGSVIYQGDAQTVYAAYLNTTARPADTDISAAIAAWEQDWSDTYGADMIFRDTADLIGCYGWADTYRLDVEALDESATKVFITAADNAAAPAYSGGKSDSLEGVTLIGRSVAVTANTGFYIHVVDAAGNATSIPVQVTALGTEAPVPGCVVVLSKDSTQVRAYLLPPNVAGVTNLQITTGTFDPHPDAQVETDTNSSFCGNPYLIYTDNGNQTLYYSYELNGRTITGQHTFNIDKIDKTGLMLLSGYPKWSANYDGNATADNVNENWVRMTNQSITAQYTFSKSVADAYLADESGNKVTPDFASVSFLGAQVTVEFAQNSSQKLKLVCVSATNSSDIVTLDLPDILTIDKVAPAIFAADVIYASDHRSATITLNVNEKVTLQSNGQYLTDSNGVYLTSQVVRENGEYTFTVSDRAGNLVSRTVSVTGIVTEGLTMVLSASAGDEGIVDPSAFAPNVGETVYVKTSRNALITVDHTGSEISASANQWTAVTITESLSGLYPIIRAVDSYGNTAIIQLDSVPLRDGKAPNVILRKSLLSASVDSSDQELEALLKDNLLASDETTPASQLVYTFEYSRPVNGGKVNVTYHVTDASGNTATCTGQIRFYTDKELTVKVNGEVVERDDTAVVQLGQIDLHVDAAGEPYKILWKSGIKTVAQVKINAQTLTSYTDEAKSYAPDFTEAGYYTVVITTQAQDTYRIILYVED